MKIFYYAVFDYTEYDGNQEKYGIPITFPDVPEANTCARNDEEGLHIFNPAKNKRSLLKSRS